MYEGKSFFADWGRQRNPIRQSDLTSMFGALFRCQKKFGFSKLYHDDEVKRVEQPAGLGIVAHNLIHERLTKNRIHNFRDAINEWKAAENSAFQEEPDNDIVLEYEYFLDQLFKSKAFEKMQKNLVFSEKSFLVRIGAYWTAGTIDVLVSNGRGKVTIIDHKTGASPMSQFEMDHGYQSIIYAAAVRYGYFFDRPEKVETGFDYYKAFLAAKNAKSLIHIGKWPSLIFGYYRDYCLAQRKSEREAKHDATRKWKGHPVTEGKITIEKGDQRGPVWYPAKVSEENIPRLDHSLKIAVAKGKAGLFDETFSGLCESCYYMKKCMSLGSLTERRKSLNSLMEELEIEGD